MDLCKDCGANLALVGRTHRCRPQPIVAENVSRETLAPPTAMADVLARAVKRSQA